MPRFFNTTGPCDPHEHYMLPGEARLSELDRLIARRQYFVIHAPRQSGKTTAMRALTARLRAEGYIAVVATLERLHGHDDLALSEHSWIDAVRSGARFVLPPELRPPAAQVVAEVSVGSRFGEWLTLWCEAVQRPVVLVLDEADVVRGVPMVSLLRQLRGSFPDRGPGRFPVSVALVGLRDLRDYLVEAKDGREVNSGSPFNIKAESLTLRNFNAAEVRELLLQHTAETGQPWTDPALLRVWERTQGQPFLVNALADQAVTALAPDRSVPLTEEVIVQAEQQLILSRTTHLHNLGERLKEDRVAPIVRAVLLGDEAASISYSSDDFQYVIDLGLIHRTGQVAEVTNPIYREVLARELSYNHQAQIPTPTWPWKKPDGTLDVPALMAEFLRWWRQNADILRENDHTPYREAAAHLAFMGFLQRVINGGGTVEREYAAARGRVDLAVTFARERHVFELKRVRPQVTVEAIREEGITQLSGYLDTLGLTEGWLLVFDARPDVPWSERLWTDDIEVAGKVLHLRGA